MPPILTATKVTKRFGGFYAPGLTLTFTTDAQGNVVLTGDLCHPLKRGQWLRVEPRGVTSRSWMARNNLA
jgi:hypothetical protein